MPTVPESVVTDSATWDDAVIAIVEGVGFVALKNPPAAATLAVSEQVPAPTYVTVRPLLPTVHTLGVVLASDVVPPLDVEIVAVKLPPTLPLAGRLLIVGVLGLCPVTSMLCWTVVAALNEGSPY